jgi:hypothetical protein
MRCRKFDFEDERKLAKVFQSRALHCATLPVERIEGPSGVKEPRAPNQFQVHAEGQDTMVLGVIIPKHFLEYSALTGESANSTLGFC